MAALPEVPRRWSPRADRIDAAAVGALQEALNLPEPLCRLLVARGRDTPDAARTFLRPGIEQLHDPLALKDMDVAVERLERAIRRGETILVHGDYDVDGISATALLTRVLRAVGASVRPFVPDRMTDGYDLGPAGLRAAAEADAAVILTADCGIVAHEAVAAARADSRDVIVTDHHTPGDGLPPALAVLNPNRADCDYPNPALCGAGVAFKLCQALGRRYGLAEEMILYHLDLVALATVADLMPLVGENRVFTHFGLRVLRQTRKPGLAALIRVAGLADVERLAGGHLSHVLAPRINAIGRLADAKLGVRLLLTEDDGEADRLARRADELNRERQATDRSILDEALARLAEGYDPDRDRGVVLAGEGWHPGVIGIVASRVAERVHRPTALIALSGDGGVARGSARSIAGFDLFAAIHDCGEHLERFGGHRAAAGFDIRPDRIDVFREAFNVRAGRALTDDLLVPRIGVDLELDLAEASHDLYRMLRHMGPFGIGNPTPVFFTRGVTVERPRVVGDGHVKMSLARDGARLEAIGFHMADRVQEALRRERPLDVAYQLHEDRWRGRVRLQARLVDVRV